MCAETLRWVGGIFIRGDQGDQYDRNTILARHLTRSNHCDDCDVVYSVNSVKGTTMTATKAIKTFFELDGGRKITMEDLKTLPRNDREELGALACAQLGETFEASPAVATA